MTVLTNNTPTNSANQSTRVQIGPQVFRTLDARVPVLNNLQVDPFFPVVFSQRLDDIIPVRYRAAIAI